MAVYLEYFLVDEDQESLEYEISTCPNDPDPVRVRVFREPGYPVPVVRGAKVAANKAVRKIMQLGARGEWPRGGLIQS
ncbi:hypothetical protein VR010_10630 [Actinomycetaceae bacterium L2_0104]